MYTIIKRYLQKYISVPDEELEEFCKLFKSSEIKKKKFLLKQGEFCDFEAFIISGLFKVFHLDTQGNEHILYFAAEDWWVTEFNSFENTKPSQLYIQALEDSTILKISKQDKEKAFAKFSFLHQMYHKMTKKTLIALQYRMIDNLSKTASQRYWDYLEKYPHIAKRLTNVQIAGYLGISHEFVSKIRRQITAK